MNLDIGHMLIHPHHGLVTITSRAMRTTPAGSVEFLTLTVRTSDLELQIPVANVELIGLREVIDDAGLQRIVDALSVPPGDDPPNWSRRYKNYEIKLASGDPARVAEAVRSISDRQREKKISAGEKRLYLRGMEMLATEIAQHPAVGGLDKAERLIADTLAS
ncbi:CarD family transcriptional regulator [Nocardiopsis sp. CT-R113]|uniref:CarD family transcriptional regulator n=1 Tax=Nocardiopsis codii TaxID=3065942 RepID=A0ABU7K5W3_9ACTN|nr:CarD family transcriptional regulator [Nocardiopsis sp. CT-R113]MEE2037636.1 CarD family transcriptional regulator [Nocardiopsis sp. CT-R113]